MLENLPIATYENMAYRFAGEGNLKELAQSMGLDVEGEVELRDLLIETGQLSDVNTVLDGPFSEKRLLPPGGTRFSDGSIRILYSALEEATARSEILHWGPKIMLEGATTARKVYFRLVRFVFEGQVIDLRPKTRDWDFLVASEWSKECRQIGMETAQVDIDGLLTYSARLKTGTNLPIFKRQSARNPEYISLWSLIFEPADQSVQLSAE